METSGLKKILRKNFSAARSALSAGDRKLYDQEIMVRILALPDFQQSEIVGSFVAFGAEPDLARLPVRRLFLPRFDEKFKVYRMVEVRDPATELVVGRYGIPEPAGYLPEATESELREMFFLVPAVACDRNGIRLGRGGGFYDRLLAQSAKSAAVIYSCQLSESPLPKEPFDRPVRWVISERETISNEHCR